MTKQPPHTTELVGTIHRMVRHRPRLKAILPEDLAQVKSKLEMMDLKGATGGVATFDLLFGIGVILSNQPEGVTMGELGKAMGVPLSTATRMVDWLVSSDYAARLPDKEDRRIVRVAFTMAGQAMFSTANDFVRKRADVLLRHFTSDEQSQLLKLLGKLADALDEEAKQGELK